MLQNSIFVLIHSPLVGPLTWEPVAHEIQSRGGKTFVPHLADSPNSSLPYWQQHAQSVQQAIHTLAKNPPLILVAHSGAGPLLPAIRQGLSNPISGYVFVDAGIPRDGHSRLDLMRLEDAEWAAGFEQGLLQGGQFPTWTANDLYAVIPNEALRHQVIAEIQPRSLPFFTEAITVFEGWPDAPCAYIKFSAPYQQDFAWARAADWPVQEISVGHFHMLVNPAQVTDLIFKAVGAA